jgi:hypothetical protein
MGMLNQAAQQGQQANVGAQPPAPPPVAPGAAAAGGGPAPLPPNPAPPPQEGEEAATPEEQQEYERVAEAMISVIYGESGGDAASNTVADSIIAEDKVGSAIQTGVTIISQVDKQVDIADVVVPQVVEDTVEMLADIAEQKNGIVFSQEEMESTLMGVWEGIMYILGGDAPIEPDFAEASAGMTSEDIGAMKQEYDARLGSAVGGQEQQQMGGVQQQAGPPAQGAV